MAWLVFADKYSGGHLSDAATDTEAVRDAVKRIRPDDLLDECEAFELVGPSRFQIKSKGHEIKRIK